MSHGDSSTLLALEETTRLIFGELEIYYIHSERDLAVTLDYIEETALAREKHSFVLIVEYRPFKNLFTTFARDIGQLSRRKLESTFSKAGLTIEESVLVLPSMTGARFWIPTGSLASQRYFFENILAPRDYSLSGRLRLLFFFYRKLLPVRAARELLWKTIAYRVSGKC